ncbi:AraC family transcriptional regulator [Lichenibacterium minor]|uniref:AraC family transcriptional regulator n=2 Tax=Lichenibacterium minor TaxID=2316528 RepID=A0A4Q2UAS7_9HYPH|nr:AraC family transcriptional regulator [Lichenibacterium minor]
MKKTTAGPPPQARSFFKHSIGNARQLDRLNVEAALAVQFNPIRGMQTSIIIEGGQSQSLSLWKTQSDTGFLTTPKVHLDVITVRFVIEGAMLRRDRRREHIGQPGRAMMVMFDHMKSEEASSAFTALTATITPSALIAAHRALEGEGNEILPRFVPVVDLVGLPLHILMRTMDRVYRQLQIGVPEPDLVFPLLEEVMIYQLLSAWPRDSGERVRDAAPSTVRPVQRACDYIEGNLSRKLLLHEIATAAGIGVRRLQTLFRADTGKTPVQFILERRLDRAHADLCASEPEASVAAIAARWGFTHMSDFSRRYRARFGETPSVALRRRG